MKKRFLRSLSQSVNRPGGGGLTLLLLLVVLVPSVCLLWFMYRAVQNERLAMQQRLLKLYQGPLNVVAARLNAYWQAPAAGLDEDYSHFAPPVFFSEHVGKFMDIALMDSVICFDSVGKVCYPSAAVAPPPEPLASGWVEAQRLEAGDPAAAAAAFGSLADTTTNAALAALAYQAKARCLLQSRQTNAALEVLNNALAQQKFQATTDDQG
ncbi:MAG TPA: hypothetical protein VN765_10850, partial [Candidatus Acidoferrum sp.]|nr:hypothetical protein [Candidatus Acidoferrum sp.]